MAETWRIDGAQGEGGGQILRTGLALAVLAGRPVEFVNIRARRPKPGLRPQHLAAVRAAAAVCGAEVRGAEPGASKVYFAPGPVRPGSYRVDVGTAGSALLVLQTVLLPLACAPGPSRLEITGGTHVPWSPCFHYVDRVYRPVLAGMGFRFRIELRRWGWVPAGGGRVTCDITPPAARRPFAGGDGEAPVRVAGVSASSRLPPHVRERQARAAREALERRGVEARVETLEGPADSPGSLVFLWASGGGRWGGATALGARGKPAERVGAEAAAAMLDFLDSGADVDPHLADQLLLPAAAVPEPSRFTVARVTRHLATHAQVLRETGVAGIGWRSVPGGLVAVEIEPKIGKKLERYD
ncbi:RNA 3'-terminal phosphate cyclase [Dissulfurirhabdus thermomarina]|nr:RNA 3'-terminal phosphate cyclase [Dissulfurirhabdus thermomarina]